MKQAKPKPKINIPSKLIKEYPFEHEIIPYEQLHPKLQAEVTAIRHDVKESRYFLASTLYIWSRISSNTPVSGNEFLSRDYLLNAGGIYHHFKAFKSRLEPGEDPSLINKNTFQLVSNFFVPYSTSRVNTKNLSKLISGITDKQESPFNRSDSTQLLKKFHYGFVDNEGSIVLLKHPLDSESKPLHGFNKLKTMFQWKQPFKRKRFKVFPPVFRAKQPVIAKLKEALRKLEVEFKTRKSKPKFALVPLRFN